MQKIAPIVQFTPIAKEKLVEVMKDQKATASLLRIDVFESGGCGCSGGYKYAMSLENNPLPNDVVEEVEGVRVAADKSNADLLRGSKIDYTENLQRRGFKIENPNVQAPGCGCGGH